MTKIVYNACHSGFDLSHEAVMEYAALSGFKLYAFAADSIGAPYRPARQKDLDGKRIFPLILYYKDDAQKEHFRPADIPRDDINLVRVVEKLGSAANGYLSNLQIRDLPSGVRYRIDEYDGYEEVKTIDGYDWSTA